MSDKSKRKELLITLDDINNLIEDLEATIQRKQEVTDEINQLLHCYDLKINILNII